SLGTYLDLARSFRSFNLAGKAINYLEVRRDIMEKTSTLTRLQYHAELSQALLSGEQYAKAVEEALKLKNIVDSSTNLTGMAPADSVFKILDSYPEETKASLRRSREEYIRNMRVAEESVRSSQRMLYNSILAQAY